MVKSRVLCSVARQHALACDGAIMIQHFRPSVRVSVETLWPIQVKRKYLYRRRFYDKFIQDNKCQILPQVTTFCTRQPYYKNNFGVFLCVIVYRLFVLNLWWCILRNIVNITQSKSKVPCFFNSCYFHNVDFFSTVVCRRCAPGIGRQPKFGCTLKKISGAKYLVTTR